MNKLYKVEEYIQHQDDRTYQKLGDDWATVFKNKKGETVKFKDCHTSNGVLSEVVLPNICKELEQPHAKQNLAHVETVEGDESYHVYGITSVNFLELNDEIQQLYKRFNLDIKISDFDFKNSCIRTEKQKLYLNSSYDFHALDLQQLFKQKFKNETDDFKQQFVNHWLTSTYLGCLDKPYGKNSSSIMRKNGESKKHIIAPHYDHDYSVFFSDCIEDRMKKCLRMFQHGFHSRNIIFLKKNYPEQLTRFFDLLITLKANPKLIDICDVTGLEEFYIKQHPFTNYLTTQQAKDKLAHISARAYNGYKSRVDLLTAKNL